MVFRKLWKCLKCLKVVIRFKSDDVVCNSSGFNAQHIFLITLVVCAYIKPDFLFHLFVVILKNRLELWRLIFLVLLSSSIKIYLNILNALEIVYTAPWTNYAETKTFWFPKQNGRSQCERLQNISVPLRKQTIFFQCF